MSSDLQHQLAEVTSVKALITEATSDEDFDAHSFASRLNVGATPLSSDDDLPTRPSKLRMRTAPLLEATDQKYKGRRVRRTDITDKYELQHRSTEEFQQEEVDTSGEVESDDDSESLDFDDVGDESFGEGQESDAVADREYENDIGSGLDSTLSNAGESDISDNEEGVAQVKVQENRTAADVEKGQAVKRQISVWDALLESRIHAQQLCTLVQRLPTASAWQDTLSRAGSGVRKQLAAAQRQVACALDAAWRVQSALMEAHPRTQMLQATDATVKGSDEEITSESEGEELSDKPRTAVKRRANCKPVGLTGYEQELSKRHKQLCDWRDTTLDSVYEKTRLLQRKGFASFDKPPSVQLTERMRNKTELVQRTRRCRGLLRVIGEATSSVARDTASVPETEERADFFDDSDFYHSLLKQLIDSKSASADDPAAWTRQYVALQKLRNKQKRNVDTKASKGRKLRFTVHQKLVSFVAVEERGDWSQSARDELFSSLFGQRHEGLGSGEN